MENKGIINNVKIKDKKIYCNEKPYFIKGARTLKTRFMDKVAEYGGNSVRIGYGKELKEVLDKANDLDLTALVGLPIKAERDGFDYDNQKKVDEQLKKVKTIVKNYKNHPAILMWTIGNELDHIPGDLDYNLKLWDAVNEIAKTIKKIDPYHPVMTVIGTGRIEKIKDIIERCPDLDLLGINSYADIYNIPDWIRKYGWDRPYVVTEWGPSGHWQRPKNKWDVVLEETSTEKAKVYKERYEKVIKNDSRCVGSYVFLWTNNRQERTHTWYNMFHDDGTEKEAVEVMRYQWTGEWPENRCPRIKSLKIEGEEASDNINLTSESICQARIEAVDPDNDGLKAKWELLPEPESFASYAGQGETKPEQINNFIKEKFNGGKKIKFKVPREAECNYRLFVYVYDGHNNVAVANIPFYVS